MSSSKFKAYVPSALSITDASMIPSSLLVNIASIKSPPIERGLPNSSVACIINEMGCAVEQLPSASPLTVHLSGLHGPATTCKILGQPAHAQSPTRAAIEYAPAHVIVAEKEPTDS